ncbi:hypothetical protein CRUP_035899, partial [Coryphaenoides rupestris]
QSFGDGGIRFGGILTNAGPVVDLSGQGIQKLEASFTCSDETHTLLLDRNNIMKLDHLERSPWLQQLRVLNLPGNSIGYIEGLRDLPCLEWLNLSGNNIKSPAFALRKRVHMEHRVEQAKPQSPMKAHPMPHFGLPFQPRLPDKSQAEQCPFSFDKRDRECRVLKEQKLEQMRNEEVPKFKAQLLPDFHEVILPEKKVLGSTKPEPFKLMVDERGAVKTGRWEIMARPNTVTHKEPFQPKKENRSIMEATNHSTVLEPFQLSTERRAMEHQEFERAAMEKEALRACMEEDQRRLEEERTKEEVAKMRQEQVHKAQPIRKYKPVELKKCDTALTVPQSPKFRFHL